MSPAYILVNPGGFLAARGREVFLAVLREMREHHGPIYVVDGRLSANLGDHQAAIDDILAGAGERGFEGTRIWGCASGAGPCPGWPGERGEVYGSPQEALISISPRMSERDAIICSAAARDGRNGLQAIASSLAAMGWGGTWQLTGLAIGLPISEEYAHEDPDPELHHA